MKNLIALGIFLGLFAVIHSGCNSQKKSTKSIKKKLFNDRIESIDKDLLEYWQKIIDKGGNTGYVKDVRDVQGKDGWQIGMIEFELEEKYGNEKPAKTYLIIDRFKGGPVLANGSRFTREMLVPIRNKYRDFELFGFAIGGGTTYILEPKANLDPNIVPGDSVFVNYNNNDVYIDTFLFKIEDQFFKTSHAYIFPNQNDRLIDSVILFNGNTFTQYDSIYAIIPPNLDTIGFDSLRVKYD